MGLITAVDIAAEPLSKTFPEPDWQGLIDDGLDPWLVALMHAPANVTVLVHLQFITKNLERIGDHATSSATISR